MNNLRYFLFILCFSCLPGIALRAQTGTVCGTANEGNNLTLTAPPGSVFTSITFASYGTPGGSCGSFTLGSCHASGSKAIVEGLALNQTSVTIPATNTTFGDPCVGVFKRLYVAAVYSTPGIFFKDADGDGFGDPAISQSAFSAPPGFVVNGTDCNDNDNEAFPGQNWFIDADGDHYAASGPIVQCLRPVNGVVASSLIATSGDCNDNDAATFPGTRQLEFSTAAGFTNSLIAPLQGAPATTYNFEADYFDAANNPPPPFYPRLILDFEGNGIFNNTNDRTIIMTEADAFDLNTADGKRYVASVSSLPTGTSWQARVQVADGNCVIEKGPFNYPDVLVQPDLELFANDILFSNANPDTSASVIVSAVIHNRSDFTAQNFTAHLVNQFDQSVTYPDVTVSNLAPRTTTTVSWTITTPNTPAWCPMQVTIDHGNAIAETNELNNSAIRPFVNGNFNLPGGIVPTAGISPAVSYFTNPTVALTGNAHYTGMPVPLPDSSVAGATVTFTLVETGASYTTFTNSGGHFSMDFPAPPSPGVYHIQGSITDFTLTASFAAEFTRIGCTLPDLSSGITLSTAGGASGSAVTIIQGEAISGSFKVANVGTGTAAATVLGVSQSGGTPSLGNISIPALASGASHVSSFSNLVFNTPGTFTLCIDADATGQVTECGEANAFCALVQVLPAQPDIYALGGPVTSHAFCNGPATIGFSLGNGGGAATGSFDCDIVVKLNGAPIDLLHKTIANIPALGSTSFNFVYAFPSSGSYAFELSADVPLSPGAVVETNETNNTASFGINVFTCKAELSLGSCETFDVTPVDPAFPGSVGYTAVISNTGNLTAQAPVTVRFLLSGGTFFDAQTGSDLAPGQSAVVSVVAPSVAPATQTLTAIADPANTIDEFNETNNTVTNSLCWEFRPVPKCVSNFWDGGYSVNQTALLQVGVDVSGLYDASLVKVRFLVSGPGISGTVNLGDAILNNPEQNCSCPYIATLGGNFVFQQAGTYTFTMITDPDNVYTECNESNNILVQTVHVGNLPDMRILSQHIAPSFLNPQPGDPITLNISYENNGQANVSDIMKLKVLVDNQPLDSIVNANGLFTNATTTFGIPSSWSSTLPGVHIIRAVIDADNQVQETNELNNEATRAVIVGEASNLHFAQVSTDVQSPSFDQNIHVTALIGNNGDLPCEADLVLSFVNNILDTIQIATIHIQVPANDSIPFTIPWTVQDPSTALVFKIANSLALEFTYDDNLAFLELGGAPVASVSSQAACDGAGGSLSGSAAGGEPPFTFSWSSGFNGQVLHAAPGSYTVVVTDALNRSDTVSGVIADAASQTLYADADDDGFGDPAVSITTCASPAGFVANSLDCDDTNEDIYPGAEEHCDNVDNDCDGQTDEDPSDAVTYFADADGDGFGNIAVSTVACFTPPAGFVTNSSDCNDADGTVWQSLNAFIDADGDHFDNGEITVCFGATLPAGISAISQGTDCDDNDPNAWQSLTAFIDADGDHYDNGEVTVCFGNSLPAGISAISQGSDCDDNNASKHPGVAEICGNNIDDDCDGSVDENCCLPCATAPKKPSVAITGVSSTGALSKFCPGDVVTASVSNPDPKVCSYNWIPPAGIVILSGQGTPSVSLEIQAGFTASGNLSLSAVNTCGSITVLKPINRGTKPATPATITGEKLGLCERPGVLYSTNNVSEVQYAWSFEPAGLAQITNGQGTSAVTVNFEPGFLSGTLIVVAENACGTSAPKKLSNLKAQPDKAIGLSGPSSACRLQTGVAYSVNPSIGASSYIWSAPLGATISDGIATSSVNSLTTSSTNVTVNFGTKSGNIKVIPVNNCGSGAQKTLAVTVSSCLRESDITSATASTGVRLYPNPAHSSIALDFEAADAVAYQLKVIDMMGRVALARKEEAKEGDNHLELDLNALVPGVYQLVIAGEGLDYKERFVIQR